VTGLRIVLYQPSTVWKKFSIDNMKILKYNVDMEAYKRDENKVSAFTICYLTN